MNTAQMEVRALRAENQMLMNKMNAMKQAYEQQDSVGRFIAAALSGACARMEDPVQAAEYAIAAANSLVMVFEGTETAPEQAPVEAPSELLTATEEHA